MANGGRNCPWNGLKRVGACPLIQPNYLFVPPFFSNWQNNDLCSIEKRWEELTRRKYKFVKENGRAVHLLLQSPGNFFGANWQSKRMSVIANAHRGEKIVRFAWQTAFWQFFQWFCQNLSVWRAFFITKKTIKVHGVTQEMFFGHAKRTPQK